MGPSPEEPARTDKSFNVSTPSARLRDKKRLNDASGTAHKQMTAPGGKMQASNKLNHCEFCINDIFVIIPKFQKMDPIKGR